MFPGMTPLSRINAIDFDDKLPDTFDKFQFLIVKNLYYPILNH